jgi:hypothetical protein
MATKAPRANYKKAGIDKKQLFTVAAKLEAIAKGLTNEAREGAAEFGEKVLLKAAANAPKQTGALRASGKVNRGVASNSVDKSGKKVTVEVSFGGRLDPNSPTFSEWDGRDINLRGGLVTYAAVIHENHNGGGRFFLKKALQDSARQYQEIVRKRTQNLIRRGGKSAGPDPKNVRGFNF